VSHRRGKNIKPTLKPSPLHPYLKPIPEGMLLNLWIQPGARKTDWSGFYGQQLKLSVQAPPVEGAANQSCIAFLAQWFGLKKSEVILIKGGKSRSKVFLVKGLDWGRCLSLIPGQHQDLPR
jgi:uncharacterized protein